MTKSPGTVSIGDRLVGPDEPTYIIGEVGSNHDRNLGVALELVEVAARSGCDAVKFQTFQGPDIASSWSDKATALPEQYRHLGDNLESFYAAVSMPDEFHEPLAEAAADAGIDFLSSPFSEAAVDRLVGLGVPALKIASFELVHHPLLRHAAATGLPLLLSTGMANLGEIEAALEVVGSDHGGVVLLHCGSSYPLEPKDANLRAIRTMADAFQVVVGYSDHTTSTAIPVVAVTLGARVIEKHITLDRSGAGPDHPFAMEPDELASMVSQIRDGQAALGSARKRRMQVEEEHARRGRRSVFVARDIKAGETITMESLKVVRPGAGMSALELQTVLGRVVVRDLPANTPLTWEAVLGPRQM